LSVAGLALGLLLASEARAQRADEGGSIAGTVAVAAERYRQDVGWLAADEREGRGLGSDGLAQAGAWLEARFEAIGLEPAGRDGGYRYVFAVPVSGSKDNPHAEPRWHYAFNVVGRVSGEAPDRLPGAVVIGAHYDHLGYGGEGSLEPDVRAIHNGADDNGSGTAALLEVSRVLEARRHELRRDVYLIAFSAEERGLIGSRAFVRSPSGVGSIEDVVAMLNMDMVGRLRDERLQVLGGDSAEEWKDLVAPLCGRYGLECVIGGDGFGSSDQSAFFEVDIPVLHFFTGAHEDYHRPGDDARSIDAEGAVRIAWLVSDAATELASREAGLTLVKTAEAPPPRRMGGRARLGTIPDYAGSPEGKPGLLLSAVRPGSPAEQGGLRRGDLIVQIDDMEIRDINDFMTVLQEAEPGQTAAVVVVRDEERVELQVTYGSRE
jgi:hypothetical protein